MKITSRFKIATGLHVLCFLIVFLFLPELTYAHDNRYTQLVSDGIVESDANPFKMLEKQTLGASICPNCGASLTEDGQCSEGCGWKPDVPTSIAGDSAPVNNGLEILFLLCLVYLIICSRRKNPDIYIF